MVRHAALSRRKLPVQVRSEPPIERGIEMEKSPNDGGCWFCHQDHVEEAMHFSTEFDSYFHWHCLLEELKLRNPEAAIIAQEFDISQ